MPSRRRFLAGASTAALGATAGCLTSDDQYYPASDTPDTAWWPQPAFDRYNTAYNPAAVGPADGVTERWSMEIPGPSARPVIADGTAFLPTANGVVAVDAATSEEQWREPGDDPPLWPRDVRYHDGTLYVGAIEEPALLALDAESGERRWTYTPREREHGVYSLLVTPEPDHPQVWAGTHGGVYSIDPATGEPEWRRDTFGAVVRLSLGIPYLFAVTESGEVLALSRDDGAGYWRQNVNGHVNGFASGPSTTAVLSTFGGPTYGIGDNSGAVEWRVDGWTADGFVQTSQTVVTTGHRLRARDADDGSVRWTGGETTQCGPAAAGDTVYAASEDAVTAYDFGGGTGVGPLSVDKRRWSHAVEGRPERGLAVAEGAVFVLTEGGGEDERSMAYALEGT